MHNLLYLFAIDVFIQLCGFIISYGLQTEKLFDLTGSLTFLLLSQLSWRLNLKPSWRQTALTTLVAVWAIRLGGFLFYRVLKHDGDQRFVKVKTKPVVFFMYWMVQALWVFITLLPVLVVNDSKRRKPLGMIDYSGFGIWLIGLIIEVTADWQKNAFRNDPQNAGKFISEGLWSISRHPNYFGEILVWFGIFILASSILTGWRWICVISPCFVYYLLNYVSGIPILERGSLKRYGELPEYKNYINNVPILTPFFGKT